MPDGLTELDTSTHAGATPPGLVLLSPAPWQPAFLTALALTGNVSEAVRLAKVSRARAYQCRAADTAFAAARAGALEVAVDALEAEARRRALEGERSYKFTRDGRPLLHPLTGEPYYERVVSDQLLMFLLRAYRPQEFGHRAAVEVRRGPAAVQPTHDLSRLSPAELAQLEAIHRKLRADDELTA